MANWAQAQAPTGASAGTLNITISNVGDVVWFQLLANQPSATVTVSCTNVGTISYFGASVNLLQATGFTMRQAWARATATGTATITGSSSLGAIAVMASGSVTPPSGTTAVAQDGSQLTANGTGATINFPSQTPAGPNDFFLGYGPVINTASAGSTSGFTYFIDSNGIATVFSLDPSTHVGAAPSPSAPTCPSGGGWDAMTGLLVATIPTTPVVVATSGQVFSNSLAAFTAWVNPEGQSTTVSFNYGSTSSYGSNTGTIATITGSAPVYVSYPLTGLSSGQTVHFQVVAVNGSGTTNGPDAAFTTTSGPHFSGGLGLGAAGALELGGSSGISASALTAPVAASLAVGVTITRSGVTNITSAVALTSAVTATGPATNIALTCAVAMSASVTATLLGAGSSLATGLTPIIILVTPVYNTVQNTTVGTSTPIIPLVRPTATTASSSVATGLTGITPVIGVAAVATAAGVGGITAAVNMACAVSATLSTSETGVGAASFGFTGAATGSSAIPGTGSASAAFTGSATGSVAGPSTLAVTSKATADGGSPLVTASFTPTAGAVLVVEYFGFTFSAGTASISDNFGDTGGGTWTPIANSSLTTGAFGVGYGGWYRLIGSGPSSGTVTVTASGWTGGELTICVDQVATGSGTLSVPQTNATTLFPGTPGTGSVALPSAPASSSVVWSGTGNAQTALTPTVSSTGFTQLDLINTGTSSSGATAYIIGSGPQTTNWQGLSTTNQSALAAVEVAVTGGTSGVGVLTGTFTAAAAGALTIPASGALSGTFTASAAGAQLVTGSGTLSSTFVATATGTVTLSVHLTAAIALTSAVSANVTSTGAPRPAPRPIFVRLRGVPPPPPVQYGPRYFTSLVAPIAITNLTAAVTATSSVVASLTVRRQLTCAVTITAAVGVTIVSGSVGQASATFTATAAGTLFTPSMVVTSRTTFDGGSPATTASFLPVPGSFLIVGFYGFPFAAGTATITDTFGDTGGTAWTAFTNSSFTSTGTFGNVYGGWYRQIGTAPGTGAITVAVSGWTGGEIILCVDQVTTGSGTLSVPQTNVVTINFPGTPANGSVTLPSPPASSSLVWSGSGSGEKSLTPTPSSPGFTSLDLVNAGTSLTEATAYIIAAGPQTVFWQNLSAGHTNALYALEMAQTSPSTLAGTGALSVTFTAIANAVVNIPASASSAWGFTASGVGSQYFVATAALTTAFTGTATGVIAFPGAGTVGGTFTASATGTWFIPGVAALAGTFTATGTATTINPASGTGALSGTFTATAAGTVVVVGTTAALTATFTASATGTTAFPGTGSLAATFSATATATTITPSSGTGALSSAFTAQSTGTITILGAGQATASFSATAAAGTIIANGGGSLTTAFGATAAGTVITVIPPSAAGMATFSATATGVVVLVATGGLYTSFTATAVGTAPAGGTAGYSFLATAKGTHSGNAPSQVIQASPRFFIIQSTDDRGWD